MKTQFNVCLTAVKFSNLIPFKHPICPPAFVSLVFAIPFKLEYGEKQSTTLTRNGFVASGRRRTEYTSSKIKARPMKITIHPRTMLPYGIQLIEQTFNFLSVILQKYLLAPAYVVEDRRSIIFEKVISNATCEQSSIKFRVYSRVDLLEVLFNLSQRATVWNANTHNLFHIASPIAVCFRFVRVIIFLRK